MTAVEEIVRRIPAAALATDEHSRVVAWNEPLARQSGVAAPQSHSRLCRDVLHLRDEETGRRCHELCPIGSGWPGGAWMSSRVVRSGAERPAALAIDCTVVRCAFSATEHGAICFLHPVSASPLDIPQRLLRGIEALYPSVALSPTPRTTLAKCVSAIQQATASDAADLFALDRATGALVPMGSVGLPSRAIEHMRDAVVHMAPPGWQDDVSKACMLITPATAHGGGWYVAAPLVAAGRFVGLLGIASLRHDFDIPSAARVLFALAQYIGPVLLADPPGVENPAGRRGAAQGRAGLEVRCLGRFGLAVDGEPIALSHIRRAKALTLLRFLVAQRGRLVARDVVTDLLWPDLDQVHASGNLRVVLHALRRGLVANVAPRAAPRIVSYGDRIGLEVQGPLSFNSDAFEEAAKRGRRADLDGQPGDALAAYREALARYAGEYMEDEPNDAWCIAERQRLHSIYVDVVEQTTAILTSRREPGAAIAILWQAVNRDRTDEHLHRTLMTALLAAGRADEAVRHYRDTCRYLQEDLGVAPSQQTASLFESIRSTLPGHDGRAQLRVGFSA